MKEKLFVIVTFVYVLLARFPVYADTAAGVSQDISRSINEAIILQNQRKAAEERRLIPQEPITEKIVKNGNGDIRYVSPAAGLNLRKGPSENAPVIKVLETAARLKVLKYITWKTDGKVVSKWLKVRTDSGIIGYVSKKFVQVDKPIVYLGEFLITYYCPCAECCGWTDGPTASGVYPVEGLTIAADPSIPFGTKLMIDGSTYTVQDRGGAIKGNHIDVFSSTHKKALSNHTRTTSVYQVY